MIHEWVVIVAGPNKNEINFHAVSGENWTEPIKVSEAFICSYPKHIPEGGRVHAIPSEEFYAKMAEAGYDDIVQQVKEQFANDGIPFNEDPDSLEFDGEQRNR